MKKNSINKKTSASTFNQLDLDQFIVLNELPVEQYLKTLKEEGIDVDGEDAVKMIEFLNLLARITIKEIFSAD